MINNIRMTAAGNAGSENVASSDTNPRQVRVFYRKARPPARRSCDDGSRIARDRFPQNQRWSRSYRASSFLYER